MPPRGYTVTYRCDRTDSVFAIRQLAENVFGFTSAITQAQAHADDESATVKMEDNASARFERLKQCFKDYFKDVQQWINAVDKNAIDDNDIYDIDMLEQWSRGSCMLIGDACHVMSPSLGQGANVGLEDSSELAVALGPILRSGGGGDASQIQTALTEFWSSRLHRVSTIHAASREYRHFLVILSFFEKRKEGKRGKEEGKFSKPLLYFLLHYEALRDENARLHYCILRIYT
jgi:2-polyprenyl-6-methoxyphenol hydroxylase-like FAD-dependent oxidoreductase